MARTFRTRDPNFEPDIIVIGSGMAGLCTASLLSRYGNKVMVLEQHDEVPGGSMHSFKLGSEWVCSGWHYIGKLIGPTRLVWNELTDYQQMLHDPQEVFDTNHGVGSLTATNFEQKMMIKLSEFDRITKYCNFLVLVKLLWWPLAWCVWAIYVLFGFRREVCMPYGEWCKKVSGQSKEHEIWWTQRGDHGMKREETIAIVGGVICDHYCRGVSHVDGGITETVRRICERIKSRGGCVLIQAPVQEIVVDNGAVRGVRVHGQFIAAKQVVCSNVFTAANLLKPPPEEFRYALTCGPSAAHGCVFMSITGKRPSDLGLPSGNVWIDDKWFISHKESPTGTVVYIIWQSPYFPRGGDYESRKDRVTQEALNEICKIFPKLKECTQDTDSSTPATTEHYLASQLGCSYGLAMEKRRFGEYKMVRALSPETTVPGLFLTGQDVMFPGIIGAMMDGVLTAQVIAHPGWRGLFHNVVSDIAADAKARKSREEQEAKKDK